MKPMQAWVLWNEKRMQYQGTDMPTLFASRDKAIGAIQFDPESTLNGYWEPVLVRLIPAVKRGKNRTK